MSEKCWCGKVTERMRRDHRTDEDPWTWYQCPEHGYPDSAQSWKARAEKAETEIKRLITVFQSASELLGDCLYDPYKLEEKLEPMLKEEWET